MKLAVFTFFSIISLSCSHSIYAASFCEYDVKEQVQKITRSQSMQEEVIVLDLRGGQLSSKYATLTDRLKYNCSVSGGSRFEVRGEEVKEYRYSNSHIIKVYGICVTTEMIKKSEEEIAKERCEKLNKCEEKILDSSDIDSPELKKIAYLLERYKC